jgi:hypothetical protein
MRTWVKQAGRSPSLISLTVQQSSHTVTLVPATARNRKKYDFFSKLFRRVNSVRPAAL